VRAALTVLLPVLAVLAAGPARAALAWVTNQGDDTVVAVDTATGKVVQTVPVGAKPAGVALSPDGRRIYVTNPEGRSLSVVTRGAGAPVVQEVPAGAGPLGVAVAPDGRVFVADWYGDTVAVLDPAGAPLGTLHVGASPSGMAADPAGTRLYVANREGDSLSVIDLATLATVATVPVGHAPFGVTVQGGRVFVANVQSGDVTVLDAATLRELRRLKVGEFPYAVAVTPDGARVLVTNQHSGTLSVFDGPDYRPLPEIPWATTPRGSQCPQTASGPMWRYGWTTSWRRWTWRPARWCGRSRWAKARGPSACSWGLTSRGRMPGGPGPVPSPSPSGRGPG
jgi:YVTN family beta-propeller protein